MACSAEEPSMGQQQPQVRRELPAPLEVDLMLGRPRRRRQVRSRNPAQNFASRSQSSAAALPAYADMSFPDSRSKSSAALPAYADMSVSDSRAPIPAIIVLVLPSRARELSLSGISLTAVHPTKASRTSSPTAPNKSSSWGRKILHLVCFLFFFSFFFEKHNGLDYYKSTFTSSPLQKDL